MRTALAISVALHGLLWGPVAWVAHNPLPPVTHEIAVELVPADKLDELTKAQEPAKPEVQDVAKDQKNELQPAASAQGQAQEQEQAQAQPNQQAPGPDAAPKQPAQIAQPAQGAQPTQIAQPAQGAQPTQSPQSAPAAQPVQAEPAHPAEPIEPTQTAAVEPEAAQQAAQAEPAADDEQLPVSWINSPLMTASIGFDTIPSESKLADQVIAAFKARMKECWAPPFSLATADAQKLVVVLRVSLQQNGALAGEPTLLAASASPKGAALLQTAMQALQKCQPFSFLPEAKYKEWKKLDLSFSPAGLSHMPSL